MQRCMIVDNSDVIRKVAKRILADEDLFVVEAKNADEAVALANEHVPDFIIVDSSSPETCGDDLIRRFKNDPEKESAKIIACITQVDLVEMTRAKRAGADEFLLKPFDRKQLLSQFQSVRRAA